MTTKTRKKNLEQIDETYEIDYDLFTIDEIVKIINFYHLMKKYVHHKVNKETIKNAYYEYKNIIHNLALEKKYNQRFFEKSGISIYQVIKSID
jgi:hypothetical protein